MAHDQKSIDRKVYYFPQGIVVWFDGGEELQNGGQFFFGNIDAEEEKEADDGRDVNRVELTFYVSWRVLTHPLIDPEKSLFYDLLVSVSDYVLIDEKLGAAVDISKPFAWTIDH